MSMGWWTSVDLFQLPRRLQDEDQAADGFEESGGDADLALPRIVRWVLRGSPPRSTQVNPDPVPLDQRPCRSPVGVVAGDHMAVLGPGASRSGRHDVWVWTAYPVDARRLAE